MSLGAESRMEKRLKKLEAMIRDPRSAVNLESLLNKAVNLKQIFCHVSHPVVVQRFVFRFGLKFVAEVAHEWSEE
ncbi:rho-associated protein kinase 2 isoform X1 [Tachysurus ichikawai]